MAGNEKKLGVISLAALVVSAMIGGGIFYLGSYVLMRTGFRSRMTARDVCRSSH